MSNITARDANAASAGYPFERGSLRSARQATGRIDAVSDGMAMDPRTGGRIYAGVGYGGSCFPKDMRALDNVALTSGANVELLRSVININNRQRPLPVYALRERFGEAIDGLRVGVLGLAFKPNANGLHVAQAV